MDLFSGPAVKYGNVYTLHVQVPLRPSCYIRLSKFRILNCLINPMKFFQSWGAWKFSHRHEFRQRWKGPNEQLVVFCSFQIYESYVSKRADLLASKLSCGRRSYTSLELYRGFHGCQRTAQLSLNCNCHSMQKIACVVAPYIYITATYRERKCEGETWNRQYMPKSPTRRKGNSHISYTVSSTVKSAVCSLSKKYSGQSTERSLRVFSSSAVRCYSVSQDH